MRPCGSFSRRIFGTKNNTSHSSTASRSRQRSSASGRLTAAAGNERSVRSLFLPRRSALYALILAAVICDTRVTREEEGNIMALARRWLSRGRDGGGGRRRGPGGRSPGSVARRIGPGEAGAARQQS